MLLRQIRALHVLGIESSCDDAAVAIINYGARQILSDRRHSDLGANFRSRGIVPYASARHHRAFLPRLIDEALAESRLRASDIDAVAVSTRPGIVICLKTGVDCALSFARDFRRPLIPVHHMRAHALVMRLLEPGLEFPFCALLISGGHFLICLVESPWKFRLLSRAKHGSPGECLDKLARQLGLQPVGGHYGAALEQCAKSASPDRQHKYALSSTQIEIDPDFSMIKKRYLLRINRGTKWRELGELAELCASIQHTIVEYTCQHLEPALAHLANAVAQFRANPSARCLVVAGGVAANEHFAHRIGQVAATHGFRVFTPPKHLCTDNGVMVAWMGGELLEHGQEREEDEQEGKWIHKPDELPDTIWTSHKAEIGPRLEDYG